MKAQGFGIWGSVPGLALFSLRSTVQNEGNSMTLALSEKFTGDLSCLG